MEGPVELLKKVLVIGDQNTGKTSLVRKYIHGIFQPSLKATIGVDFSVKMIPLNDKHITLQIWDIGGQEQYGKMTRIYFQSAVGALVVCDITRPETFDAAIKWKRDLDSKVFLSSGKPVPALLLVNKCDLGKLPKTEEEMDTFCMQHGFSGWCETSAKEDVNVSTAFLKLLEAVLHEKVATPPRQPHSSIADLSRSAAKKRKPPSSCCGSSKCPEKPRDADQCKRVSRGQKRSLTNPNRALVAECVSVFAFF